MGGHTYTPRHGLSLDEVDELKAANSITDILAERGHYSVRMAGRELVYRSPLRDECYPSFYVDPEKAPGGLWYDFGTGRGGDVITLIKELDGLDNRGALEYLRTRGS